MAIEHRWYRYHVFVYYAIIREVEPANVTHRYCCTHDPALAGSVDTRRGYVMNRMEERETGAVSIQPDDGGAHVALPIETAKKGKKVQYKPFTHAGSLPMIPAHLVEKIFKGQYVDLSDLLQDNILLAKKSASSISTSHTESGLIQRYKKREFTKDEAGMLIWIRCFAVYTAVVC